MDAAVTDETIVTSMSTLATELPLSPELVLVSPPEVASLARGLLLDPEPVPRPTAAATRARSSRLGVVLFAVSCLANCVTPFAVAVLASAG